MTIAISGVGTKVVTNIVADEAPASSDFLKMENEIKGKTLRERERERERERTESQFQIVLIIDPILALCSFEVSVKCSRTCPVEMQRSGRS